MNWPMRIAIRVTLVHMMKRWCIAMILIGVGRAVLAQTDTLPELNRRIVAFVDAHKGMKVDRGECWDLAAVALDSAGAKWDRKLGFGRLLDPQREEVLPGD